MQGVRRTCGRIPFWRFHMRGMQGMQEIKWSSTFTSSSSVDRYSENFAIEARFKSDWRPIDKLTWNQSKRCPNKNHQFVHNEGNEFIMQLGLSFLRLAVQTIAKFYYIFCRYSLPTTATTLQRFQSGAFPMHLQPCEYVVATSAFSKSKDRWPCNYGRPIDFEAGDVFRLGHFP